MNYDIAFSRADLSSVLAEVKKHGGNNRDAGITLSARTANKIYFFEYSNGNRADYFCTEVRADNAYEARAKGWREWLDRIAA